MVLDGGEERKKLYKYYFKSKKNNKGELDIKREKNLKQLLALGRVRYESGTIVEQASVCTTTSKLH